MVKIYWNFFQICPEKNSDHFSIWSEKLKFGRKTADRRPLFQALKHRCFVLKTLHNQYFSQISDAQHTHTSGTHQPFFSQS